ncbi:hypothetical protein CB0940_04904 [Cercospora beticola]|uniref:G-patch domain-containing protein n=1 Tax=Cercospora beticola TaxID=122368 RepID=A0A2G5HLN5_CERBT|nr:hypothetical protein CB0940_04904 [Cercospora beticola]PIA93474.1 hypothetical protein CB0940_04904 [Cercospora beticola]WPB02188.1 hypothetical protein RHO25_006822 [Cercospora beticola]
MSSSESDSVRSADDYRTRSSSPENEVLFEGRGKPARTTARPPQQPTLTDNDSLPRPAVATGIFTASAASSSASSQPPAQHSIFLFSPEATPFSPQHGSLSSNDKCASAQSSRLPSEHQVHPRPTVSTEQSSGDDAELLALFRAQLQRRDARAPPSNEHFKYETSAASSQSGTQVDEDDQQLPRKQPRYILLKEQELKQQQFTDPSPTYTWARVSPFDRQVLPLDAPWEPDPTRPPKSSSKTSWSTPAKSTLSTNSRPSTSSSSKHANQQALDSEEKEEDEEPLTWETLPRTEDLPIHMPFGKKMLEKNGWKEGEGLGKRGEGRSKVLDLRLSGQARGHGERGGVGS